MEDDKEMLPMEQLSEKDRYIRAADDAVELWSGIVRLLSKKDFDWRKYGCTAELKRKVSLEVLNFGHVKDYRLRTYCPLCSGILHCTDCPLWDQTLNTGCMDEGIFGQFMLAFDFHSRKSALKYARKIVKAVEEWKSRGYTNAGK